jgi:hypothetical protein
VKLRSFRIEGIHLVEEEQVEMCVEVKRRAERWLRVTAPVLPPKATVNPILLRGRVEMARSTTPETWRNTWGRVIAA